MPYWTEQQPPGTDLTDWLDESEAHGWTLLHVVQTQSDVFPTYIFHKEGDIEPDDGSRYGDANPELSRQSRPD